MLAAAFRQLDAVADQFAHYVSAGPHDDESIETSCEIVDELAY
ncbi:hypothetical protein I551_8787 [Mycobacterium ulcerans str. Harvey]|uniref:Uncharacterized protein n=1 Tax=Mycobacterium ulcerans str. Harvey TaxID=1299332 RepID=A0ABP3AS68_MYCUL|nr:hypothetical protein I551_8787 [Mycobacterium ulcerans str. Harvey]